MLLKKRMMKLNSMLLNLKMVLGYKNIIISAFIIFISNLIGIISYYKHQNFWFILYNTLTDPIRYLLLFSVIIYNIIYISSKLKNYLLMIRTKNYKIFLKHMLENILLFIIVLLIISLVFNVIISMVKSNFNFKIINFEYYSIPMPFYLIIYVFREVIIIFFDIDNRFLYL